MLIKDYLYHVHSDFIHGKARLYLQQCGRRDQRVKLPTCAGGSEEIRQELPVQQQGDTVSSLVYEANDWMRDPVYDCVRAISFLQNQLS
uniref:LOB domain-containing protein n=1 Tax=Oryza glumipatula TaxID=40148 RepID=A0A0D9ZKC8_9ORYZ